MAARRVAGGIQSGRCACNQLLCLLIFCLPSPTQEMAESVGPLLDKAELDAFVLPLLRRAGASSVAGRDNFLAVEADAALAALVAQAGEARAAAALLAALSSKSPNVRAKAAMHLDACLAQHGARLVR